MQITASMVKDLREKTGAGMLDCKKALQENNGDFEAALDWLRAKGIAKAEKKSSRAATEGLVAAKSEGTKGVMVEVNAETDFVAKNDEFQSFVTGLTDLVFETSTTDVEALKATTYPATGKSVADTLTDMIAKIGENMTIRRATMLEVSSGMVTSYIHMGGKIGVLVGLEGTASDKLTETAKGIAMHVAASNPAALNREQMDPALVERERAVFMEQARESGKPEAIMEKIVDGRVSKFFEESCLVDQAFVMDTDRKVGQVAKDAGATITGFARFQLGEGLEKKEDNFAEEVAKAVSA